MPEHDVNKVCDLHFTTIDKRIDTIEATIKDYPVIEKLMEQQISSNEKQAEAMENQARVLSEISLTLVSINGNQDRMSNELVKQGLEIEKIQAKDEKIKTRKMENWDKLKIAILTSVGISFVYFMLTKIPDFLAFLAK